MPRSNVAYIPLDKDILMIVDLDDVPILLEYTWDDRQGRPRGYKKGVVRQASQLVIGGGEGFIDHKNGDPLDNRKQNLRWCKPSQNSMNKPKQSNNKSGWKGVSWRKDRSQWRVCCQRKDIGCFNCVYDAATAYNFAAAELHGEFAVFNTTRQPWLDGE